MKIFLSPKQCLDFVNKGINTGNERTINDTLHFGVGQTVYAWRQDVISSGVNFSEEPNNAFLQVNDIPGFLGYLLDRDGYLIAD